MREIKFKVVFPILAKTKRIYDVTKIDFEMSRVYFRHEDGTEVWKDYQYIKLLQYTELKDKNGKEDYHKDICKYYDDAGNEQIGIIEWVDGGWWLIAINGDEEGNQNVLLAHAKHENLGNLYENPELLEAKI